MVSGHAASPCLLQVHCGHELAGLFSCTPMHLHVNTIAALIDQDTDHAGTDADLTADYKGIFAYCIAGSSCV